MTIEAAAEFSGKTVEEIQAMETKPDWQEVFDAEYEALRGIHSAQDAALIAEYYANHKTGRSA